MCPSWPFLFPQTWGGDDDVVAADPSPFPLLVPSLPPSPFPPRPHSRTHTSFCRSGCSQGQCPLTQQLPLAQLFQQPALDHKPGWYQSQKQHNCGLSPLYTSDSLGIHAPPPEPVFHLTLSYSRDGKDFRGNGQIEPVGKASSKAVVLHHPVPALGDSSPLLAWVPVGECKVWVWRVLV